MLGERGNGRSVGGGAASCKAKRRGEKGRPRVCLYPEKEREGEGEEVFDALLACVAGPCHRSA